MILKKALNTTADGEACEETDPRSASVLGGAGSDLHPEDARRAGLLDDKDQPTPLARSLDAIGQPVRIPLTAEDRLNEAQQEINRLKQEIADRDAASKKAQKPGDDSGIKDKSQQPSSVLLGRKDK